VWLPHLSTTRCDWIKFDTITLKMTFLRHVLHLPPSSVRVPLVYELGHIPLFYRYVPFYRIPAFSALATMPNDSLRPQRIP
jgi:hypothetical protein